MADNNKIAAQIGLHPITATIWKYTADQKTLYSVTFGHYFDDGRWGGEGYDILENISEKDLPTLTKIVGSAQAEIVKLREAECPWYDPADAI